MIILIILFPPGETRQAENAFNEIRSAKAPLSEKSVKLRIDFCQKSEVVWMKHTRDVTAPDLL